jgi:hypothetical protein
MSSPGAVLMPCRRWLHVHDCEVCNHGFQCPLPLDIDDLVADPPVATHHRPDTAAAPTQLPPLPPDSLPPIPAQLPATGVGVTLLGGTGDAHLHVVDPSPVARMASVRRWICRL